jgi:hypothetical protein
MLAFPLRALLYVGNAMKAVGGAVMEDAERAFLLSECKDGKGQLATLTQFLKETIV